MMTTVKIGCALALAWMLAAAGLADSGLAASAGGGAGQDKTWVIRAEDDFLDAGWAGMAEVRGSGAYRVAMQATGGNPEIVALLLTNEALRNEATATYELWQDALDSLNEGDGSAIITQAQVDALESFLNHLSEAGSPELQATIAAELARLGPLDEYVGLTIKEAKRRAIGDVTLYLPLVMQPQDLPIAAGR